jgi:hypothetical protein
MSSNTGKKTLTRDWVEIRVELFKIIEDMLLLFKGRSYNI